MSVFYDAIEQIPEDQRDNYEQVEFDGKQRYQHKEVSGLVSALKKEREEKLSVKTKWDEYEKQQREQSEKMKSDAERKALEKLKAEGKVDEILADAERRIGETTKQYQERIDKMVKTAKQGKRDEIVSDLSGKAIDSGRAAFKRLAAMLVDYDPETGKEIYFNEDGSASSAKNRAEFFAEVIDKSETFAPLLKGDVVTTGGGNAQGSTGGSASVKTMKRSQFDSLGPNEKMEFTRTGGKIT